MTIWNKLLIAVCIVLVVILVALRLFLPTDKSEEIQEEPPVETTEQIEDGSALQESSKEDVKAQTLELINESSSEKDLATALMASRWVNEAGSAVLSFSENTLTYIEDNGQTNLYDLTIGSATSINLNNDSETLIATAISGNNSFAVIGSAYKTPENELVINTVSMPSVFNGVFTRVDEHADFVVDSTSQEAFNLVIPNSFNEVEAQIKQVASRSYPSATKATWSGIMSLDWTTKTLDTQFGLDNEANTVLYVRCSLLGNSVIVSNMQPQQTFNQEESANETAVEETEIAVHDEDAHTHEEESTEGEEDEV